MPFPWNAGMMEYWNNVLKTYQGSDQGFWDQFLLLKERIFNQM